MIATMESGVGRSRSAHLCALVAAGLWLQSCGVQARERSDAPPSIVVVLIDTLRADHLGCYGYERPTSPRIDAFAREAVTFEHALAQCTWTKPSTASIHTGLYPSRHGVTTPDMRLDEEHETLAERLSAEGYRTAAIGWQPYIFGGSGFAQGFEHFEPVTPPDLPGVGHAEYIVDQALAWLAGAGGERPFFLYVHILDPHAPYEPPEPFRARFDRGVKWEHDGAFMMAEGAQPAQLSAEDWEHYTDLYDAEIAYTDSQVGRLFDALDRERTAVFLLADHGEELNDHGFWSHTPTLHEELVHIPLIASFPAPFKAELAGKRVADLAQQVDLMPTVLDLLGLPARADLPGRSLLEKARGAAATAYGISEVDEFGHFKKAVVAGRTKLIRSWSPQEGETLYDLRSDPGERQDVLAARPAEAAELGAILDEHTRGAPVRYALAVENRSPEMITVSGYLVTEKKRVRGSDLTQCEIFSEQHVDWDGPFLFNDAEVAGRSVQAVRFTLRTRPGDRDGFYFTPPPDEPRLEIYLHAGGGPPPVERVFLGAEGAHPESTCPVVLDLAAPDRYASGVRPAPQDGETGYAVFVWRTIDAAAADEVLDDETLEQLKRLGYAADR